MAKSVSEKTENTGMTDGQGADTNFASVFGGTENSQVVSDFNSGFEGTNAVSQIFRDSGGGDGGLKKQILLFGVPILLIVAAVTVALLSPGGDDEEISPDDPLGSAAIGDPLTDEVPPNGDLGAIPNADGSVAATADTFPGDDDLLTPGGDAALGDEPLVAEAEGELTESLLGGDVPDAAATPDMAAPAEVTNSSSWQYNEQSGGPSISAASGTIVEISRNPSFIPIYLTATANGAYRIPNPPPGTIYWRERGSSEIHEITVTPPTQLDLSFANPGSVSSGTTVSWSASGDAAFYRLEFSPDKRFANLAAVFATANTSIAVGSVTPGSYHVRVVGFNKASGRWEQSSIHQVNVQ